MRDLKIWIRQGDSDDYHDFDIPFEAGYEIGSCYSQVGNYTLKELTPKYQRKGIELPGFENLNYISLFWGDDDAQNSVELNTSDKLDFEQGLKAGFES